MKDESGQVSPDARFEHAGSYFKDAPNFREVKSACCKLKISGKQLADEQLVSFSGFEQKRFFYNKGGAFEEISGATGLGRIEDGRAFVRCDFDRDGAEDLLLWNYRRNTILLLKNEIGAKNRFIGFQLKGKKPNTFAIGSTVRVTAGSQKLMRYLNCGEGYQSCPAPEVHFGVGQAEAVDVEIRWPSGAVKKLEKQPTNAWYEVDESTGAVRKLEFRRGEIAAPAAVPPPFPAEGDALKAAGLPESKGKTQIAVFLGSREEREEILDLRMRGATVFVAEEDAEVVKTTASFSPECRVVVVDDAARDRALGADALLPAVFVVEDGKIVAKFAGVEAGPRATRWLASRKGP